jgi:hypothetical protein
MGRRADRPCIVRSAARSSNLQVPTLDTTSICGTYHRLWCVELRSAYALGGVSVLASDPDTPITHPKRHVTEPVTLTALDRISLASFSQTYLTGPVRLWVGVMS